MTASVDPAYWADPTIIVDTPDGLGQPSPHRALETGEIIGILKQYRAAAENAKKASNSSALLIWSTLVASAIIFPEHC